MAPAVINPSFNSSSFSCPHCSAIAHQDWFQARAQRVDREDGAIVYDPDRMDFLLKAGTLPENFAKVISAALPLISAGMPAFGESSDTMSVNVLDINFTRCFSCRGITIWHRNNILYPSSEISTHPNDDLPPDIKIDFIEAQKIYKTSPRGAAALLRLCIQKICNYLEIKDKNIDSAIASLVKKGLDSRIEQALDIVRVVGNEAVHPGQLDLKDDRETAEELFSLVNIIADAMISQPKRIAELYAKLPESKRNAIEKRERPLLTDQTDRTGQ